jgi:hypothetical protein
MVRVLVSAGAWCACWYQQAHGAHVGISRRMARMLVSAGAWRACWHQEEALEINKSFT